MDNLQHRRDQLRKSSEQDAQRNRKREHPLAYGCARDDVMALGQPLDQVSGGSHHAPHPARRAQPAPLTGEGDQLLVRALIAAQPQEAMREDAAFEKGVEFRFDKLGYVRAGLRFDLGEETLGVVLNQTIQDAFFGAPPLVVDGIVGRRPLSGLAHDRFLLLFFVLL